MESFGRRVVKFLFNPADDRWIAVLRIGLALTVVFYCLSLRKDWVSFFLSDSLGPVNREFTEAILSAGASKWIPRMGWVIELGANLGLSEPATLELIWWSLFGSGLLLLAGIFSRATAIAAVFLHLCVVKSSGSLTYGSDNFMTIGLFYLAVGPLPDRLSLDHIWLGRLSRDRDGIGFFRRVMQLHMCVIYFVGGVTKCLGVGWWNGDSLWRALIRPPFNVIPADLIVAWRGVLPIAGIMVCLLETAYPIFIWPARSRFWWLGAIILMHVVVGLTLGLYLFAFVMIVLNLAAFGPWSRVEGKPAQPV